jgi:hypothetical protein
MLGSEGAELRCDDCGLVFWMPSTDDMETRIAVMYDLPDRERADRD